MVDVKVIFGITLFIVLAYVGEFVWIMDQPDIIEVDGNIISTVGRKEELKDILGVPPTKVPISPISIFRCSEVQPLLADKAKSESLYRDFLLTGEASDFVVLPVWEEDFTTPTIEDATPFLMKKGELIRIERELITPPVEDIKMEYYRAEEDYSTPVRRTMSEEKMSMMLRPEEKEKTFPVSFFSVIKGTVHISLDIESIMYKKAVELAKVTEIGERAWSSTLWSRINAILGFLTFSIPELPKYVGTILSFMVVIPVAWILWTDMFTKLPKGAQYAFLIALGVFSATELIKTAVMG
jgi:hypothetical protein